MDNIAFNCLYRDAGNYKNGLRVLFSNPDKLPAEQVAEALKKVFLQDGLFIAHQVRIPEAFLFKRGDASSDDHCFHEFHSVEITPETPTDVHVRSINEFVSEVERESRKGWDIFDPHVEASL